MNTAFGRAASAQTSLIPDSELVENLAATHHREPRELLFFYGHHADPAGPVTKACLSQWYPASFLVQGRPYSSAEQYMLRKAELFGDDDAAADILASADPRTIKAAGRRVRGFDEREWAKSRYAVIVDASIAKFAQNPKLGKFLVSTGGAVLVEASPYDRIWGIGLAASDPRASDPGTWRGLNLLGFALMTARNHLLARANRLR